MKPRLLDAYCGAGGATKGYQRTGFHVTGIDIDPHPHYCGDCFIQADAIWYISEHGHEYDAIHASPPRQDYFVLRNAAGRDHKIGHLIEAVRMALITINIPWVIENVIGAPMRPDFRLCGCLFGLPGLRRPRLFETSWGGHSLIPPCYHLDQTVTVSNYGSQGWEYKAGSHWGQADREHMMGTDWMTRDELIQVTPPVFTQYIGGFLMAAVRERAA